MTLWIMFTISALLFMWAVGTFNRDQPVALCSMNAKFEIISLVIVDRLTLQQTLKTLNANANTVATYPVYRDDLWVILMQLMHGGEYQHETGGKPNLYVVDNNEDDNN